MKTKDIEIGKHYAFRRGIADYNPTYRVVVVAVKQRRSTYGFHNAYSDDGVKVIFLQNNGDPGGYYKTEDVVAPSRIKMLWDEWLPLKAKKEEEDMAREEAFRKKAERFRAAVAAFRERFQVQGSAVGQNLLLDVEEIEQMLSEGTDT
jgi:hypothetical protein